MGLNNPTGYSRVLTLTDSGGQLFSNIIGDDILAQQAGTSLNHLHYDGHGSTRQLYSNGSLLQTYDYDAYGNAVGFDQSMAGASYLYTGEQADVALGDSYYLRARFYMPGPAMFTSLDPYFGDTGEPQSLHKYAYVHGDPVNAWDPTGMFSLSGVLQSLVLSTGLFGLAGSAVLGGTAALLGGSIDEIRAAAWLGLLYGAAAGLALSIGKATGNLTNVISSGLIATFAIVFIELAIYAIDQGLGRLGNELSDNLRYRITEGFIAGFGAGALAEAVAGKITGAGGKLLGYMTSFFIPVIGATVADWVRGTPVNWAQVITEAVVISVLSLALNGVVIKILQGIGGRVGQLAFRADIVDDIVGEASAVVAAFGDIAVGLNLRVWLRPFYE